ncbi:Uncharacterized protein TPAR_08763, partial [Tolypocladium paradoxum]
PIPRYNFDRPALFDIAQVESIKPTQIKRASSRSAPGSHGVVAANEAYSARGAVHKSRNTDTIPTLIPRLLQPYVTICGKPQRSMGTTGNAGALIPAVVNIVYKKLLQYDITARAFTTRSTSFEGPVDDVPDENSPQIVHRKMFLQAYLNKLCSDPSRMEFWEYLDKVG